MFCCDNSLGGLRGEEKWFPTQGRGDRQRTARDRSQDGSRQADGRAPVSKGTMSPPEEDPIKQYFTNPRPRGWGFVVSLEIGRTARGNPPREPYCHHRHGRSAVLTGEVESMLSFV
ncbi:MAG: hypothetical protein MZU79_01065 [Anaerotruncus sp.]|nr:hypothetical protein [Anaerotruncus sp.]